MSHLAPSAIARTRSGGTLVEAVIAACLASMILGALASSSAVALGIVRGQKETVAANLLLQERLEQLRAGGWSQITDGAALRDQILGRPSTQERLLNNVIQQITVTTYPAVSPAGTPLLVEKGPTGPARIVSQPPAGGISLRNRLAVRVDLRVQWTSRQNQRLRMRETSTVVSLGGLLR